MVVEGSSSLLMIWKDTEPAVPLARGKLSHKGTVFLAKGCLHGYIRITRIHIYLNTYCVVGIIHVYVYVVCVYVYECIYIVYIQKIVTSLRL